MKNLLFIIVCLALSFKASSQGPDVGIFGEYSPDVIEVNQTSTLTVDFYNNSFTETYPVGEVFIQVNVPTSSYTVLGTPTGSILTYFSDFNDNDGDGVWFGWNTAEIPTASLIGDPNVVAEFTVQGNVETPNNSSTLFDTGFDSLIDGDNSDNNTNNGLEVTAILPVEFVSFDVKDQNCDAVTLAWETAEEVNNAGFEVERAVGKSGKFERVGFVKGSGERTGSYTYEDPTAGLVVGEGTIYYRLKQIDLDGRYDYSDVVAAKITCDNKLSFKGFPNPTINTYNLEISGTEGIMEAVIMNDNNAVVNRLKVIGNTRNEIDFTGYTSGVYNLVVRNSDGEILDSRKVIKIAN